MAKVFFDEKEYEIPDGETFQDQAEEAGVPFGCTEGICGSCRCDVLEGADNLSELTPEEEDMGMSKQERLVCQCKIKQGVVKFRYW